MALKFLNKKGWHTGSLRNIENVWKAEQKHEAEQKKLEELRKQIQEEKERSEFRRLQEQAGLVPRQERLEFLYDSGLSVGKPSSEGGGFKSLEALPQPTNNEVGASSSSGKQQDATPGALFEEKQPSANDAWRKLHSDPLLMIRQREQDALARIKNNPVKMAMIRKSVESSKKHEDGDSEHKKAKRKHRKHSSSKNQSDSEDDDRKHRKHASSKHRSDSEDDERKHHKRTSSKHRSDSEDDERKRHKRTSSKYHRSDSEDDDRKRHKRTSSKYRSDSEDDDRKHRKHASSKYRSDSEDDDTRGKEERSNKEAKHRDSDRQTKQQRFRERSPVESREEKGEYCRQMKSHQEMSKHGDPHARAVSGGRHDSGPLHRRRNAAPKLSEEERAAKLREMQRDAEVHEEQRWTRLKKADENDAKEATRTVAAGGKTFLDAAHKSVYGAEQGGSATIEESVRRRSHFHQSRSATEGNAFRR